MSVQAPKRDRQLRRLERWRALELEHAQIARVSTENEMRKQQDGVAELEKELANTHDIANQCRMRSGGLSVDELQRVRDYAHWQCQELDAKQISLQTATQLADEARKVVLELHQKLSSIEKLRERLGQEMLRETLAREQQQLDEYGMQARSELTFMANKTF